jgi:hypothetical protein
MRLGLLHEIVTVRVMWMARAQRTVSHRVVGEFPCARAPKSLMTRPHNIVLSHIGVLHSRLSRRDDGAAPFVYDFFEPQLTRISC